MNLQENTRRWLPKVRQMALSLPMALLAAMVLVGINEVGHMRSQDAVEQLAQGLTTRSDVNKLLQSMLDAETGQRGYLLTGNETYLEPYDKAVATVQTNLDSLRMRLMDAPADMQEFALLSRQISRKLAEMELSLRLRRQGNEDAWKFILNTDVGKEHMEAIRQHAQELIARSDKEMASRPHVYVFGAGHVGSAVVRALTPLGTQITWVDGRAELFEAAGPQADNVRPLVTDALGEAVSNRHVPHGTTVWAGPVPRWSGPAVPGARRMRGPDVWDSRSSSNVWA